MSIFSEEELLEIKQALKELPEQIYEARIKAKNFSELDMFDNQLKEIEAEHIFLIREEKGDNDKPKYSNDKLREARLKQILNEDPKYQDLLKKKREVENQKMMADLEVSRLIDTFSANKHLSDFASSVLKEV